MGVVPAERESPLIELDVIRDPAWADAPERQKAQLRRTMVLTIIPTAAGANR